MEKDNKIRKRIGYITILGVGILGVMYLINKNRKQAGIILNQQHTIDGLMKEVKNLSYHLGKKTKIN